MYPVVDVSDLHFGGFQYGTRLSDVLAELMQPDLRPVASEENTAVRPVVFSPDNQYVYHLGTEKDTFSVTRVDLNAPELEDPERQPTLFVNIFGQTQWKKRGFEPPRKLNRSLKSKEGETLYLLLSFLIQLPSLRRTSDSVAESDPS